MHSTLTTQVTLEDAVYKIAEIARAEDPNIARVYIETSDQGEYLTASNVTYRGEQYPDANADRLDEQLDEGDAAVEIEDWASSLSWGDAKGEAPGWVTVAPGYYYIDVDEALKAQPPVEIKPVDLVTGVLASHRATHKPLGDGKKWCSCGITLDDLIAFRQHLAEKIVEVLS